MLLYFFFQAEDGIRDLTVTGVHTCALPICSAIAALERGVNGMIPMSAAIAELGRTGRIGARQARLAAPSAAGRQIGRASCRERVLSSESGDWLHKKRA